MRSGALALLAALALGCGSGRSAPDPVKKDAAVTTAEPAPIEIPTRPLGMPDLASYGWRKRGGHPAFRIARTAEGKNKWADVVTICKQALAADPGHLEAAWLLAAGLGRLGKLDQILPPLQAAVAGDFGKWGHASLELAELQPFLKTPTGEAWRRRVEHDRVAYIAALARSVVIASRGDLYAYDAETPRWHRLTRTNGAVVGALRVSPTKIAYVTRQREAKGTKATLAIGTIDLAIGRTSRPIELRTKGPITVAYSAKTEPGVWIYDGAPHGWRRFDDNFRLSSLPAKSQRPPGPWLEVKGRAPRLHLIPIPGITADWDHKGLASAIAVGKSGRVVQVPAPGQIDGNTTVWSPDRSRLAFIAQLDDQCTPGAINAAAFVADATTGAVTELVRAESLAIGWLTDRKLTIDKGGSVIIFDLDHPHALHPTLEGADGLLQPRRRATCTPALPDDPPAEPEPEPSDASVEPTTGNVVEPP